MKISTASGCLFHVQVVQPLAWLAQQFLKKTLNILSIA